MGEVAKQALERKRRIPVKKIAALSMVAVIACVVLWNIGYQLGYGEGNQTGYQIGCSDGYESGNSSGYQHGYSDGNASGYDLGYEIGFLNGSETGFSEGYIQGVKDGAGTGYNIRDPTYREVLDFVFLDRTDRNQYSEDYTCFNFAADFEKNAFQQGYRCGLVYLELKSFAHAIVCFDTTDAGLVFIEPQTDEIVEIAVGQTYCFPEEYVSVCYEIVYFAIIW